MLPTVNEKVIESVANEWVRLDKNAFKFCIEQIDLYKNTNKHLLVAIDELITNTFVECETEDTPSYVREINRGRAFAVVCLVLKMIDNQIEIDELYKIYNN